MSDDRIIFTNQPQENQEVPERRRKDDDTIVVRVDTSVYNPDLDEEVETNAAANIASMDHAMRAQAAEDEYRANRKRHGSYLDFVDNVFQVIFDPERIAKFKDAFIDADFDREKLTEPVITKLFHEASLYPDVPFSEILEKTCLRGIYRRKGKYPQQENPPASPYAAKKRKRTGAKSVTHQKGYSIRFEEAGSLVAPILMPVRFPANIIANEELAIRKSKLKELASRNASVLSDPEGTLKDAIRTLNDIWMDCMGGYEGRCLVSWSVYMSYYLSACDYEKGMQILKKTSSVILSNLNYPAIGATNISIEDLPVYKSFRDAYLLNFGDDAPATKHVWSRKSLNIMTNMMECMIFSLAGKYADKPAIIKNYASEMLNIADPEHAAESVFIPAGTYNSLSAHIRRELPKSPHAVIFTIVNREQVTAMLEKAYQYAVSHPASDAGKKTALFLATLLSLPIQTIAPASVKDTDMFTMASLYSAERIW